MDDYEGTLVDMKMAHSITPNDSFILKLETRVKKSLKHIPYIAYAKIYDLAHFKIQKYTSNMLNVHFCTADLK